VYHLLAAVEAASQRNSGLAIVIEGAESGYALAWAGVGFGAALLVLDLLLFTLLFSATLLRAISPAVGGAQPIRARIVIDSSATKDLELIGLPLRRNRNVTLPLDILADTGNELFIAADLRYFRLPRTIIKGANLKLFAEDVLWELDDFYDLTKAPPGIAASPTCASNFADAVQGYLKILDIPLHHSSDLSWQCGDSCYKAAEAIENARDEELAYCKALSQAPSSH